jgi:hypothetical protein
MSGLYVFAPSSPTAREESVRASDAMHARALRLAGDRLDHLADGFGAGFVVHHGRMRGWGAAASPKGRLLIAGAYYFREEDEELGAPAEALDRLLTAALDEGASLRGSYAFACFDDRANRLVIETDLLGTYPLYVLEAAEGLYVASELKALRPFVGGTLDEEAVAEYLRFGFLASRRTFLRGIWRLPMSHRLVYEAGRLRVQPLRRPSFTRNRPADESVLERLHHLFQRSIRRVARENGELAVSLSGGMDSRLLCLGAHHAGVALQAVSMGQPGSRDCSVAQDLAEGLGIPCQVHEHDGSRCADWFERAAWVTEGRCPPGHMHYLDGMFQGAYAPLPMLHGLLGGAVLAGSYDPANGVLPETARRQALGRDVYWPEGTIEKCCGRELVEAVAGVEARVLGELRSWVDTGDPYSDLVWLRFAARGSGFIMQALGSQVLPWTDLVTPFLDPEYFALAASIDRDSILNHRAQIRWGMTFYPECARWPRVHDGVLVRVAENAAGECAAGYRRLSRRRWWRYVVTRLSGGWINLPHRESFPYYDQWYRRWGNLRALTRRHLLGVPAPDEGLWKADGLGDMLRALGRGKNVWQAVGGMLMVRVLAGQLGNGTGVPEGALQARAGAPSLSPGGAEGLVRAGESRLVRKSQGLLKGLPR